MLAEKKRGANIGVGIGFVPQLLGNILQPRGGALSLVGLPGDEEVGSRLDGVPDVLAGLLIHGLRATDGDRYG